MRFIKNFKISFYFILIFFSFFSYTVYSIISKHYNFLFTSLVIFIFILFHQKYKESDLSLNIKFNKKDLLIFFSLSVISILFNYKDLQSSLHGDEMANALRTQRTSIYFLYEFFKNYRLNLIENIRYKDLVHFISFLQLLFIIFISFLIVKKKNIYLLFIIIITIFFRFFLKDFGMHPPVNHLLSIFLTSIFGLSDFVFRLSYLILYIVGFVFLYKQLGTLNNFKNNFLIVFFLFSIPLGLLSSTNVDHSLWGFVFLMNFLIYYYFNEKINYKLVVLLISLFSMARITNFILIMPILIDYIYNHRKNLSLKELVNTFYPLLFFIPFVLKILIFGSNVHAENGYITFIETLKIIKDLLLIKNTYNFSPIYILPLVFLGIVIFLTNKNKFKVFNVILIFVVYYLIFSSISKSWVGHPKYLFEFMNSFIIFFLVIVLLKLKYIKNILILVLLFTNIYYFQKIDEIKFSPNVNSDFYYIRDRHNYKQLFNYIIKNHDDIVHTVLIGESYGFIAQILNNFKVYEAVKIRKLNQKIIFLLDNNKNTNIYEVLSNYRKITSIIITSRIYRKDKFFLKNWNIEQKFISNDNKNNYLFLLKRNAT